MAEGTPAHIGRRLREIRVWRGLSLRAVAEQAKFTAGYLSQIERGLKPVDKRSTLDALAAALQVAPSELAGESLGGQLADPEVGAAQATLADLEAALGDVGFGDAAVAPRPWPEVAADLQRLNDVMRPAADYAAQGAILPRLILELQALTTVPSAPRRDVLIGLMDCYHSAAILSKNLGVRGLPALAAYHAVRVAEELEDPAYLGYATWLRATALGGSGRERMRVLALQGADELEQHLGDERARQMYGALHLQAGLANAALRRADQAVEHIDEAGRIADELGVPADARGFGTLYFGPDNVGIWKLSVAVELGDAERVREIARGVVPDRVPAKARQAMYWADLGRGLAASRATRDDAVTALRRAEDIAPQRIRTHPLVRETVVDLLNRARREAGGRELRGMAFRMGLAG